MCQHGIYIHYPNMFNTHIHEQPKMDREGLAKEQVGGGQAVLYTNSSSKEIVGTEEGQWQNRPEDYPTVQHVISGYFAYVF